MGPEPPFCRYETWLFPRSSRSKHRAQHFAANIGFACVVVGHDALGGRKNGDTQAVVDARQIANRDIDAAAGLGDPRHLADHRLAVEILQLDLELAAAVGMVDTGITADEALILQNLEHADAKPRARRRDLGLLAHLRVVDARDQIADWIVHLHAILLPARLHEAGNKALGTELAERDARQPMLAIDRARAPGDLAAVAVAGWRRVARQFR